MPSLPHPQSMLAGCVWLPRLAAKIRLHRAGQLPREYQLALGSKIGVDGYFCRHFKLTMAQVTEAVAQSPTNNELALWFGAQPGVTPAKLVEWNASAPKLGSWGHPGYFTLCVVKWLLYPKIRYRPVETLFEAIIIDEDLEPDRNVN